MRTIMAFENNFEHLLRNSTLIFGLVWGRKGFGRGPATRFLAVSKAKQLLRLLLSVIGDRPILAGRLLSGSGILMTASAENASARKSPKKLGYFISLGMSYCDHLIAVAFTCFPLIDINMPPAASIP